MDVLLEKMLAQGWVGRVNVDAPRRVQWGKRVSDGDHWVLLANLGKLTLADLYRLFVFKGVALNAGVAPLAVGSDDGNDNIDAGRRAAVLARKVENAVEQGLGMSLQQHFGSVQRE
jgi:membrane protein